jgi:acyl-CoA thioesterase FadM
MTARRLRRGSARPAAGGNDSARRRPPRPNPRGLPRPMPPRRIGHARSRLAFGDLRFAPVPRRLRPPTDLRATFRWTSSCADGYECRRQPVPPKHCLQRVSHPRALEVPGVAWLRPRGVRAAALRPVIFREEVRYRREIGFGDSFDIDLRLGGLADDGSQWRMIQRFRRADGVEAARLVVAGAWINLDTRRLVSPTAELLAALRGLPAHEDSFPLPSLLEPSPAPASRLGDRRGHSPPPTKARTSSIRQGG